MRFEITAWQHPTGPMTIKLEAATREEAIGAARQQGLDVIAVRRHGRWPILQRRARGLDLLLFSQQLQSLLGAGLSLIEALAALARNEAAAERSQRIAAIIVHLREGKSFSQALREFPGTFPPLFLALAAASEQTGDLGSALARFIAYRQQMDILRKRVVTASIYPALLLGVGGLIVLFLMLYVVPRFARIYDDFGHDLPFMSRLLMAWGDLIQAHGLQFLPAIVLGVVAFVFQMRRKGGWRRLLEIAMTIGPVRKRVQAYTLARFYRTMGLLEQGGIPLVSALGLAGELLSQDMRLGLYGVLHDLRAGAAFSETMERHGLAPPVASELLKVGEKAGDIGAKMIRIADFYDEDMARWIAWFIPLFEPLLMLTIGLFIAFIVVLLYLPIFELAGSIQ